MDNLSAYKDWLKAEGYQPSTITVTLRHLKAVGAKGGKKPVEFRAPHVRRYLRYVAETRRNPLGRPFAKKMRGFGLEPAAPIRKAGGRMRDALTAAQWSELRGKLRRKGDAIDTLLIAYMHSPYRISAFLRLRLANITEEDVTDRRSFDWLQNGHTRRLMRAPLYALLCPTERCAYYRMRTRLRAVCEELSFTVDFNTLYKSYHALEAA